MILNDERDIRPFCRNLPGALALLAATVRDKVEPKVDREEHGPTDKNDAKAAHAALAGAGLIASGVTP